jgi:hypothetical protein
MLARICKPSDRGLGATHVHLLADPAGPAGGLAAGLVGKRRQDPVVIAPLYTPCSPDRRMTSWRNSQCVRTESVVTRICGHAGIKNGPAWPNQRTCRGWRNCTPHVIVGDSGRLHSQGDAPQYWILAFAGMTSWIWRARYWLHFTPEICLRCGSNENLQCRTLTLKLLLRSLTAWA